MSLKAGWALPAGDLQIPGPVDQGATAGSCDRRGRSLEQLEIKMLNIDCLLMAHGLHIHQFHAFHLFLEHMIPVALHEKTPETNFGHGTIQCVATVEAHGKHNSLLLNHFW